MDKKNMPRAKNSGQTIKRIFSYMGRGQKFLLGIVVLCILISSATGVAASLFIKSLIDNYTTPLLVAGGGDFNPLLMQIILMACILGFGVLANYVYNYFMVIISQSILKKIRDDMFRKMQRLPIKYFDTHTHGDIMSHYTNDTDSLESMLCQSVPQIISSVATVIMVFFAMLYLSVYLTLVVIAFLLGMMLIVKNLGAKSGKYFVAQQQTYGKTTGFVEEMLNGQKVVKVFNHEPETIENFDKINDELCFNSTKANKYANIFMPIMSNLSHLQYVVIAIVGGLLAVYGAGNLTLVGFSIVEVGTIASFLQLSRSFSMPISQVSQQMNSIILAVAGAERIFTLMDEAPEVDNGNVTLVHAKKVDGKLTETDEKTNIWAWKDPERELGDQLIELRGDVRFFDVDFGYNPDKTILHNISLYAKPGHKIAFVGATGAGKTTITNLINRFYDIANGKIKYDGIDINRIKKDDLRHSIGMVLQDTNLFTGTIKENIRYGNLDATDEQIFEAAKLANADDFIQRLPQGYDTMLTGDGANLSQGQKQLLSIARATVANTPVMILDEATSSIDTHTEALVQQGMDSLMHGRTVFVIAHRLSTVQNSNVIMVLDGGRIIEKGTHEDLIAARGRYYELYSGAFELE